MRNKELFNSTGFAIAFNIIFNLSIGFLTISSFANFVSRFGAFVITAVVAYLLLTNTHQYKRSKRFIRFCIGSVIYLIAITISLGGYYPITLGVIPCLLGFILITYFGDLFFVHDREQASSLT